MPINLKFERSLNFITTVGGTLIFCTLSLTIAYYSYFGVSITSYLSFEEILILNFSDITKLSFIFIVATSLASLQFIKILLTKYDNQKQNQIIQKKLIKSCIFFGFY